MTNSKNHNNYNEDDVISQFVSIRYLNTSINAYFYAKPDDLCGLFFATIAGSH